MTALRLEASRGLLIFAPQRSISDVAFACGFESLATFYRAFRVRHQNTTPSDFRAQRMSGS